MKDFMEMVQWLKSGDALQEAHKQGVLDIPFDDLVNVAMCELSDELVMEVWDAARDEDWRKTDKGWECDPNECEGYNGLLVRLSEMFSITEAELARIAFQTWVRDIAGEKVGLGNDSFTTILNLAWEIADNMERTYWKGGYWKREEVLA